MPGLLYKKITYSLMLGLAASTLAVADDAAKTATKTDTAEQKADQNKLTPESVIAKVNGKPIKMIQLVQELQTLPPQMQQLPPEQLFPRLRDQLIQMELVVNAAKKLKLQDSEDVKKLVEISTRRALAQAYMPSRIKAQVSETTVKAAYDNYIKNFKSEKELKVSQILVKDEETAKGIISELKKGADFAKLAQEKSTDMSGKEGGSLGFMKRGEMLPAFADVAFNLKVGSYTESPVKTELGYHVIKIDEMQDSKIEPFEKRRDELAAEMSQEIVMKAIDTLRSQAKIERFDEKGELIKEEKVTDKKDDKAAKPAA